MAFASTTPLAMSVDMSSGDAVYMLSVNGVWLDACTNFEQTTAQTATQLRRPLAATASNSTPINLAPAVTRILVRASYDIGVTAITTGPEIWIYGFDSYYTTASPWVEGTTNFMRLDQVGSEEGNTVVTCVTAATAAGGNYNDGTFRYSAVTSFVGYDVQGCKSILVLQATQTAMTGETTANCNIQVRGLN